MKASAAASAASSLGEPEKVVAFLFDAYGLQTYAFFRRRVGMADVAADLNQELYLRALKSVRDFRHESSPRTWLFGIAHHLLTHLRERWRNQLTESLDRLPESAWARIHAAADSEPEQAVWRAERSRALGGCLAKLPEIQRAVVVGHYYRGETLDQLTRRLRLGNASGARGWLLAAQRSLRRCLERAGVLHLGGGRAAGRKP